MRGKQPQLLLVCMDGMTATQQRTSQSRPRVTKLKKSKYTPRKLSPEDGFCHLKELEVFSASVQ